MARDLPVVVLDLASLDFCDEAGLHALSGAAAGTKVIGGIVHLAAPTRQVRNLLTAAKLESLFPLHHDLATALAAATPADAAPAATQPTSENQVTTLHSVPCL